MREKILVSKDQIKRRLFELAKEIAYDFRGRKIVIVSILKGAVVVTADLMRALHEAGYKEVEMTFLVLKSYYLSTTTSKDIHLVTDIDLDVKNRDVLIVDDVFDTGKSFRFVDKHLKDKGAKTVTGFALLAKPDRQEVVYRPKYIGFNVADMWLEGYGMDSAEKGRANPDVIGKTNE